MWWRAVMFLAGAVLAAAGIVWTLQGLGYIAGSFMTGQTRWAVIGPVTALAGLVIAVLALRRPPRALSASPERHVNLNKITDRSR